MKYQLAIIALLFLASCSDSGSSSEKTTVAVEEQKPKVIPGLVAVDIHANFTALGFTLEDKITSSACTWTCKSNEGEKNYSVKIFGPTASTVDRVDAMVIFPKADQKVRQFIGYTASVPYEGANSKVATQWALDHFDNGGDTIIGTVRFNLIKGNENSRILKLNAH